jgi:hypothetical protein
MEVIERLLLDRVDTESRGAAIGREYHRIAFALAHEAQTTLAVVQPAVARTQVALDAAVVKHVPPARRVVLIRLLRRGRSTDRVRHEACPSANFSTV